MFLKWKLDCHKTPVASELYFYMQTFFLKTQAFQNQWLGLRRGPSGEGRDARAIPGLIWRDSADSERANRNGSLGPQQTLKKALAVPPNPRRVAA